MSYTQQLQTLAQFVSLNKTLQLPPQRLSRMVLGPELTGDCEGSGVPRPCRVGAEPPAEESRCLDLAFKRRSQTAT